MFPVPPFIGNSSSSTAIQILAPFVGGNLQTKKAGGAQGLGGAKGVAMKGAAGKTVGQAKKNAAAAAKNTKSVPNTGDGFYSRGSEASRCCRSRPTSSILPTSASMESFFTVESFFPLLEGDDPEER